MDKSCWGNARLDRRYFVLVLAWREAKQRVHELSGNRAEDLHLEFFVNRRVIRNRLQYELIHSGIEEVADALDNVSEESDHLPVLTAARFLRLILIPHDVDRVGTVFWMIAGSRFKASQLLNLGGFNDAYRSGIAVHFHRLAVVKERSDVGYAHHAGLSVFACHQRTVL